MFHCEAHLVRTHDLLEIDAKQFISSQPSAPQWVEDNLRKTPFVVVRRGPVTGREIPIGVRGTERNQRWAGFCPKFANSILTPQQLLSRAIPTSRADAIPALRALNLLKERWKDLVLPWGPGGSVGFEFASGRHVANPESDLDIVIYADRSMSAAEAKSLWDRAMNLPAVVDIRVETPVCGFSLKEFASQSLAAILLRAPGGIVLGTDPWGVELQSVDSNLPAVSSILPSRDTWASSENEFRSADMQINFTKRSNKVSNPMKSMRVVRLITQSLCID
jgi:phosphoribosyl-dephospho-CoA transferase